MSAPGRAPGCSQAPRRAGSQARTTFWLTALALVCALGQVACSSTATTPGQTLHQGAQSTGASAARALARGDLPQAQQLYEKALAQAEAVEDFAAAGAMRINLAAVAARGGDLPQAHNRLAPLLAAPQRFGAALHAAAATRKALLYLDEPAPDNALEWADRANTACPAPCEHAATLALLRAHLAWQRQDLEATAQQAQRALELASAAAPAINETEQANALRWLGRVRSHQGQHELASTHLAQALAIDQRLAQPDRIALSLLWAGDAELRRGQAAAAREFFERAAVVYQAAGLAQSAAAVRLRLAGLPRTR